VVQRFIKWIHHVFNPHCSECAIELACPNCEELREILVNDRLEKRRLLDVIVQLAGPAKAEETVKSDIKFQPIARPSWRARAAKLEKEDRERFAKNQEAKVQIESVLIDNKQLSTDELEKELGIEDATQ
jgi:hypothetical protein